MPAPTFVSATETVWNTKDKPKTVSMTSDSDDTILALFSLEEDMMTSATNPTASGTLTWTERANVGSNSRGRVAIWSAPGADAAGWTLTGTHAGDTSVLNKWWGFNALRFSGASGVGAVVSRGDAGSVGNGEIDITTTADNSAVAVIISNWAATQNDVRVYQAVNGAMPVELTYFRDGTHYVAYAFYYADVGAAGLKTVGLADSEGTLGGHSIAAIEIKSGAVTPPPAGDRSALLPGLPYQLGNQTPGSAPPAFDPRRSSMLMTFF